jgi:hypothetical protein
VVRQSVGWTVFSLSLLAQLIVLTSSEPPAPLWLGVSGVVTLTSLWLLLSSLAEFQPHVLAPHSHLSLRPALSGWDSAQVDPMQLQADIAELRAIAAVSSRPVVRSLLLNTAETMLAAYNNNAAYQRGKRRRMEMDRLGRGEGMGEEEHSSGRGGGVDGGWGSAPLGNGGPFPSAVSAPSFPAPTIATATATSPSSLSSLSFDRFHA